MTICLSTPTRGYRGTNYKRKLSEMQSKGFSLIEEKESGDFLLLRFIRSDSSAPQSGTSMDNLQDAYYRGPAQFRASTSGKTKEWTLDVIVNSHPVPSFGFVGEILTSMTPQTLLALSMANQVLVIFGNEKGTATFPDVKKPKFNLQLVRKKESITSESPEMQKSS